VEQVRIAMVTNSRERVAHMLDVAQEITNGRGTGFFLFLDRDTFAASDPLNVEWTTGKGTQVTLQD
jgi:hypothetical protein